MTSIHAKKSENSNARFRRKSGGRKRERAERREREDRDEGEFIGPNPPGGRRNKNVANMHKKYIFLESFNFKENFDVFFSLFK